MHHPYTNLTKPILYRFLIYKTCTWSIDSQVRMCLSRKEFLKFHSVNRLDGKLGIYWTGNTTCFRNGKHNVAYQFIEQSDKKSENVAMLESFVYETTYLDSTLNDATKMTEKKREILKKISEHT